MKNERRLQAFQELLLLICADGLSFRTWREDESNLDEFRSTHEERTSQVRRLRVRQSELQLAPVHTTTSSTYTFPPCPPGYVCVYESTTTPAPGTGIRSPRLRATPSISTIAAATAPTRTTTTSVYTFPPCPPGYVCVYESTTPIAATTTRGLPIGATSSMTTVATTSGFPSPSPRTSAPRRTESAARSNSDTTAVTITTTIYTFPPCPPGHVCVYESTTPALVAATTSQSPAVAPCAPVTTPCAATAPPTTMAPCRPVTTPCVATAPTTTIAPCAPVTRPCVATEPPTTLAPCAATMAPCTSGTAAPGLVVPPTASATTTMTTTAISTSTATTVS
mmetsp:Transcript_24504/g.39261  ORF Transcript_24504/g.39261 Transcript_24504/m.39261 type:complete len:336 (+) Transcript_24504:70-1077(+)